MKYLDIEAPKHIQATISLPASKSISNRALIINALSGSPLWPENVSDCDDTRVTVDALTRMPDTIDIGAAGTAMRFLTAYLSVITGTHVITGTERMRHRPIGVLVDALRSLGAEISYEGEEGFPPLRIRGGHLQGGILELPGDVSSQYVSAMLMIAPTLEQGLCLKLKGNIVSRPYIDMTLSIMKAYGAQASWSDKNTIEVKPQKYRPIPFRIENDWSAASYWYEIVALSKDAEVVLPGLFRESTQGDSRVRDFFRPLGVETEFLSDGIRLYKSGTPVKQLKLDLVDQPDLAQTLVATCAAMGVSFCFTGLQSLKIKETDRIRALRNEMAKLGFLIQEADDSVLLWDGERTKKEPHPFIETYEDHRMAMTLAPCSLRLGGMRINNPGVVSKSYPRFWDDLREASFCISQA